MHSFATSKNIKCRRFLAHPVYIFFYFFRDNKG